MIFKHWKLLFGLCCFSYVTKQTLGLLKHVFLQSGNSLLIFLANPSKESRWSGIYIKVKTESISCTRVATSKFQVLHFIMFKCPTSHIQTFFYIFYCECLLNVWVICGPFGVIANAPIFPASLFPNVPHSKLVSNFYCV